MQWFWIEPLDTLSFRGNRLFGDPGSFGESMMPPWPSVFAGAFRAAILQWDSSFDLDAWKRGEIAHPIVGSWQGGEFKPGSLQLGPVFIGRKTQGDAVETLHFPPQDVLITQPKGEPAPTITYLKPHDLGQTGLKGRFVTTQQPVARLSRRAKPQSGWLIHRSGFEQYLQGKPINLDQLIKQSELWQTHLRTGIGMDPERRSVDEGKLFTVQHVAFREKVGFVVGVEGANLPDSGLLRLGGDGHGARFERLPTFAPPALSDAQLEGASCVRLITQAPALLSGGWRPDVADGLICAALQRAEVISGWNLKAWKPKTARRAVSAGSVYWFAGMPAHRVRAQWQRALIRADEGFGQFILAIA
ncbi:MAG TPA: hypothetical protein EYP05_02080 [Piscirickettsiaceae bacterium]|nr:hypothetical protein [Piscirickettsiaceae bacterium]